MSLGRIARPAPIWARLLPEQRHPDVELSLALQRVAFPVESPYQHHVSVQSAQQVGVDVDREVRVRRERPLRREQLDQVLAVTGGAETGDDLRRCRQAAQSGGAPGGRLLRGAGVGTRWVLRT